jgi:hypothetical protein
MARSWSGLESAAECHFPSEAILPHWTATLAETSSFPLLAARALPWHDRAVSGRDRARLEARLSRRGWIGVGALGGGVTLELTNLLLLGGVWPHQTVRIFGPNAGVLILVVAGVISLAIGAFLGARAPSWPRFVRRLIAALLVASVGSAIGGSLSLFNELTTTQGAHGLAAFVKGAIAGGFLGLILVGAVSWAGASSGNS